MGSLLNFVMLFKKIQWFSFMELNWKSVIEKNAVIRSLIIYFLVLDVGKCLIFVFYSRRSKSVVTNATEKFEKEKKKPLFKNRDT